MQWLKITQVAKALKISKAAVYKKVESYKAELKPYLKQENSMTLLSEDGVQFLKEHTRNKRTPLSEESKTTKSSGIIFSQSSTESSKLNSTFNQFVDELKVEIRQKNETISRLLNQMEEDRRTQSEERQRTDSIIMKLAYDLEGTRKSALAIEAKVDSLTKKKESTIAEETLGKEPKPIQPWVPEPVVADPLSGASWYQKIWIQIVHPEKCRRVTN